MIGAYFFYKNLDINLFSMSDLVSQNLNMIFKTPKGETVHALKDLNFYKKNRHQLNKIGAYLKFKYLYIIKVRN